ncbi:MAG: hypothetical protein Q9210_002003 [Variospora velana]
MQWTIVLYIFHHLVFFSQATDSSVSGNYIINWCQRANRSDELHHLLTQFRHALHLVLSDLELGSGSPHGFRTYFKSNTNLAITNQVFRAMAVGQNLTGTQKQPVLECTSPEALTGAYLKTFQMLCTPPGRPQSHAVALPPQGTIVLCPYFWEFPDFPRVEDCPPVGGRRGRKKFLDSGAGLRDTKLGILIHELTHLYNPLDGASTRAEVYKAQECADLDKVESVANAENWAVYAACRLHPVLLSFFAGFLSASSWWDSSISSYFVLHTEC